MTVYEDPFERYDDPSVPMLATVHIATNLMWREAMNPREPEAMDFLTECADDIAYAALDPRGGEMITVRGKDIARVQATIEEKSLALIDRLYDGYWMVALTHGEHPIPCDEEFTSAFDAWRWAKGMVGSTASISVPAEISDETQEEPEIVEREVVVDGYLIVEMQHDSPKGAVTGAEEDQGQD